MAKPEDLKGLYLFQRLQDDELEPLAKIINERGLSTGQKIFKEGDPSSSLFIIKTGTVEIVKAIDGKETVLSSLSDGEFFGEMALFEYAPRSADVRVVLDTTIFEITKDDFDQFILEQPSLAARLLYTMMEDMSRRVRKASGGAKQNSFF